MFDLKIKKIIKDESIKNYPNESCGLVCFNQLGTNVVNCINAAKDPEYNFKINYEEYNKLGDSILAVYHSHVNELAEEKYENFSEKDLRISEESCLKFILYSYPNDKFKVHKPKYYKFPDLIGRPYIYGFLDCGSLVADYYTKNNIIRFREPIRPNNWFKYNEKLKFFSEGFLKNGFKELKSYKELKKNDSIIMNSMSESGHLAVYLGDNELLTYYSGISTKIGLTPELIQNMCKFYRYD